VRYRGITPLGLRTFTKFDPDSYRERHGSKPWSLAATLIVLMGMIPSLVQFTPKKLQDYLKHAIL
jgi:hypothetical protein